MMEWKTYLFSFRGRVHRGGWWLLLIIGLLMSMVLRVLTPAEDSRAWDKIPVWLLLFFAFILIMYAILWIWALLAVSVKRWHDRDKSGWWVLISYIPILGLIWVLIENGCLKGTVGPNRFGPNPLGVPPDREP